MQLPTQQQFVEDCYRKYDYEDIPANQKWEDAHFPLPECLGGEATVPLWSADHTVQGLLQSVELDHLCFHGYRNKSDTFHLMAYYPEYLELFALLKSKFSIRHGKKSAITNKANGTGLYDPKIQSAGGKKTFELGVGVYGRSAEQISADSKKGGEIGSATTGAQRWQSTHPDFEKHISTPGALSNWQKARGIDTSLRLRRFDLEG